jgi:hypothetical protein
MQGQNYVLETEGKNQVCKIQKAFYVYKKSAFYKNLNRRLNCLGAILAGWWMWYVFCLNRRTENIQI